MSLTFSFFVSRGGVGEDEKRISSWKQKVGYKREKERKTVKGHREEDTAVGCHGYGKQLISACDVSECVWACRSNSVADKWPNTTCGKRNILTIISSSFPFISSDLSVAPMLQHNKLQQSNPLMVKHPDHDTHTPMHTHTRTMSINTQHPLPFRQERAENWWKFNNLGTFWKSV